MLTRVQLLSVVLTLALGCGRSGLDAPGGGAVASPDVDAGRPSPPEPRRVPFRLEPAILLDLDARQDGAFLVLHEVLSRLGTGIDFEVRGILYDHWAEPLGDAFLVYATGDFGPSGDATFLADNGFVVAFPIADGTPFELDYAVRVRRYDATGAPIEGSALEYADEWRPTVVGLAGGGFALGTQRWSGEVSATPLLLRVYDAAGNPTGAPRPMQAGCLRLTARPAGGFDVTCDDGSTITVRRFDDAGDVVAVTSPLEPFAPGRGVEALAYVPGGDLFVATRGHIRRLDPSGEPLGRWRDFRWAMDDGAPQQTALARSGCGDLPCRYAAVWLDPPPRVRPRVRALDVTGEPLPGPEPALAPPIDELPGRRVWYTNVGAAGSAFGQTVLAWTANDRVDGELVSVIEGVLMVE